MTSRQELQRTINDMVNDYRDILATEESAPTGLADRLAIYKEQGAHFAK